MIEYKGNKALISFEDWSPEMMILATKLHRLPKPDGETAHEVGIDRLNNLPHGPEAIEALFDLADQMKHCPDHREVVMLGKIVLKANVELNALLAQRKRYDVGRIERRRGKRPVKKLPPIRTAGPIGFTRGN
jgi:hypothetical protein